MREKLTDDKIALMEEWADKKKHKALTESEKSAVEAIEGMRKNNWKGVRIENSPLTKDEAKASLERLKKKQVRS